MLEWCGGMSLQGRRCALKAGLFRAVQRRVCKGTAQLLRFGLHAFDVAIIGGGITGFCIARDAARRGLSVALVEKRDFSCGTSSGSSKLVHGACAI